MEGVGFDYRLQTARDVHPYKIRGQCNRTNNYGTVPDTESSERTRLIKSTNTVLGPQQSVLIGMGFHAPYTPFYFLFPIYF